eukprot:5175818-Pleurochrysis_carterae.AAC.1
MTQYSTCKAATWTVRASLLPIRAQKLRGLVWPCAEFTFSKISKCQAVAKPSLAGPACVKCGQANDIEP